MLTTRKIVIYQKYATKPVILTDSSDEDQSQIQKRILEVLKSDKISILETSNDSLIFRPSEVQSVLISKNPDIELENHDVSKKQKTTYDEKLKV